MAGMSVIALYPWPADVDKFEREYAEHLKLFRKTMQVPEGSKFYTLTRFAETPQGKPPYYLMAAVPFPSAEAIQQALSSPAVQAVMADAARVSTGGAPVYLIGAED